MRQIWLIFVIVASAVITVSSLPVDQNDEYKSIFGSDNGMKSLSKRRPPGKIPGPPLSQEESNLALHFLEFPELQPLDNKNNNNNKEKGKKNLEELLTQEKHKLASLDDDKKEKDKNDKKEKDNKKNSQENSEKKES